MLNFVFPNIFISCEKPVSVRGICEYCYSGIKFIKSTQGCSICGVPFALEDKGERLDHLCARCLKNEFYFTKARSVAFFEGLLRDLLHAFKYRRKILIGKILSDVLVANVPDDLNGFNLILPVPIHLNKLREREFNQSVILCKELSKATGCKYDPFTLYKIKDKPPQISFENSYDGKKNVRNLFSLRDVNKIKSMSILIIDDVYTTGSTVNECSKLLIKAGAASVQVLTLMRANK